MMVQGRQRAESQAVTAGSQFGSSGKRLRPTLSLSVLICEMSHPPCDGYGAIGRTA